MHEKVLGALFALLLISGGAADARCSCEDRTSLTDLTQQAANAARRLPSEGDRLLARNFRLQGLPQDAATYYKSACEKAVSEAEGARLNLKSASEMEQVALHSASVHREAASFFSQRGEALVAAKNWEAAINDELVAHKMNADIATEYGTVARLYEQAGSPSKAAEFFKKQADTLAATHGRYDSTTQFALSEYNRLQRIASKSPARG